jgi:hypothetical protein
VIRKWEVLLAEAGLALMLIRPASLCQVKGLVLYDDGK